MLKVIHGQTDLVKGTPLKFRESVTNPILTMLNKTETTLKKVSLLLNIIYKVLLDLNLSRKVERRMLTRPLYFYHLIILNSIDVEKKTKFTRTCQNEMTISLCKI